MARWDQFVPWIMQPVDIPRRRYRGLIPGTGWLVAYTAPNEQGEAEIFWEPVVAFAISRGEGDGDDFIVPVVRHEQFSAHLDSVDEEHDTVVGLYTVAERADETLLDELHRKASERIRDDLVKTNRTLTQREAVDAFVQAQPDPQAFCAQMRAMGTRSLGHAWLAITLADGDARQAIALARTAPGDLQRQLNSRQERQG
jgi:hypothetical protein